MRQYFIFHLVLGMVSVFYIHPSEDFISSLSRLFSPFFLVPKMFSYQLKQSERDTCENVFYLSFIFLLFSSAKLLFSSQKGWMISPVGDFYFKLFVAHTSDVWKSCELGERKRLTTFNCD
jgi:hypothetical protein